MKNLKQKMLLSTAILASPIVAIATDSTPEQAKKNILFIAVDDLKPLLPCYGDKLAQTPTINALANRGTVFTNAYCQQAVSGPSRASLLTGMCPDRTKVWDLRTLIRAANPQVVTLPQHFKNKGYQAVGIGKIYDPRSVDKQSDKQSWSQAYLNSDDYLNPEYGKPVLSQYQAKETKQAFRKYRQEAIDQGKKGREINNYASQHIKPSTECVAIPDDAYPDGGTAKGAVSFIENYDGKHPFFLAVGFKKPHLPFVAPQKYWEMYDRNKMPLASFREKAQDSPDFAYHKSGELNSYTDIPALASFSDTHNMMLADDKAKELIHGYYAAISFMDAQLGLVIDALEKKGLAEQTIIILWGDHGWHLGDHGLWNKHSNFEQATHVPLLIIDPSLKKQAKTVNQPVEFLGIYPSLCEMTGIDKPKQLDGSSFFNLMQGKPATKDQSFAVSQYPRVKKMGYSIRDKQYRYTIWVDWTNKITNVNKRFATELYDYATDPMETKNRAEDPKYKQVVAQMEAYWKTYISKRIKQ